MLTETLLLEWIPWPGTIVMPSHFGYHAKARMALAVDDGLHARRQRRTAR